MTDTELSYREDKRPADLWFWNDYFSALDLRPCSLAVKGLWWEMLGIMFRAKPKGTLTINGKQVDAKELALQTSTPVEEIERLLADLEERRIFSRLEDGTIINRRMYREAEVRFLRAKSGRLGALRRWQKEDEPNLPTEEDDAAAKGRAEKIKMITEAWNAFAERLGLQKIWDIETGSTREKHLLARMKRKDFDFAVLLAKIEKQPFLLGKNKDAWTVSFDWIICPSNYTKIMEEQYPARIARDDTARDRHMGAAKRSASPEEKAAQEEARKEFQAEGKK